MLIFVSLFSFNDALFRFPARFSVFFLPACQEITSILSMIPVYNDMASRSNRVDLGAFKDRDLLLASIGCRRRKSPSSQVSPNFYIKRFQKFNNLYFALRLF